MMKRAFLALLVLSSTLSVEAQNDPDPNEAMSCQRDSQGFCRWVPTIQRTDPADISQEISAESSSSSETEGETQIYYEWSNQDPAVDPGLKMPGFCAKTPDFARYRWSQAMESGDLNRLIAAYDWVGQSDESALPLIERLQTIPRAGVWERGRISFSSGNRDLKQMKAPWRWSAAGQVVYLAPVKRMDCWFLVFTHAPRESVDAPIARRGKEPEVIEPGVYQF